MEKMTEEPEPMTKHRILREVLAMKEYYVTFRSVTHGQRGERLLRSAGISCNLIRTPRWMEARGCGYSLRLKSGDISREVNLLRRENVTWQKMYVRTEEGGLEEMEL